jgi:two-component sensor histidine kinase
MPEKTQSLLGRENWDRVGLREVLDQVLDPFRSGEQEGGRFMVDGDDILLEAKTALTLAMVFHELATNATKHGALSNDTGQIEIAWRTDSTSEGPSMHLRWQESGGPLVTSPNLGHREYRHCFYDTCEPTRHGRMPQAGR